jgi:2-oxoglutarate dehydrogenase E1 component
MTKSMHAWRQDSPLSGSNIEYIEALYDAFLHDPNSVPSEWLTFFTQLPPGTDISHQAIREHFRQHAQDGGFQPQRGRATEASHVQLQVAGLVNAYREHGHLLANLDPLGQAERAPVADLTLAHHHLTAADLDVLIDSPLFSRQVPLRDLIAALEQAYCSTFGVEYLHISNQAEVDWIQQRVEVNSRQMALDDSTKQSILKQLTLAEGLEKYLGSKYVGQKRFSLEGAESCIVILEAMIQSADNAGVKEMIMGMTHRGRINVLINILGKTSESLFADFEGRGQTDLSGDVKYHMGFSSDRKSKHGVMHLALAFNPSHLEIISPVVQGSVRSRLRRRGDLSAKQSVVPVLMHGDAAFSGQGVVMETFNFSQARGYATGGAVHIVINNQIGFTTSNPLDARSTLYCTDIAKAFQAPILHVNGDDPEACVFVATMALEYRQKFSKDIVIDLVCYRRHGHNEADEPSVTQPKMYHIIRQLETTRAKYAATLVKQGVVTAEQPERLLSDLRDSLDRGEAVLTTVTGEYEDQHAVNWRPFLNAHWDDAVDTSVELSTLQQLASVVNKLPDGFKIHSVVQRLLKERVKMMAGETPLNWGCAEMLAYASLIHDGYPLRLSGQDSGRGTFAHRHAVLHESETGDTLITLQHISEKPDQAIIIDSVLSEEAVLAFEYGYAASEPNVLVIWEAQFGDFVNGAQVVIDQFISSGEQKWGRLNGVVMFLPHGYEGQGPEHSSARLERFMQLCAQHNMQVCTPTTPAQMFHMLRRQMLRKFRKPLIVMTPKSLLRHKLAVSQLDELAQGQFQVIIPEIDELDPRKVQRVVLCGGKVYYDLLQKRREQSQTNVALIRIEQLYPFPKVQLTAELEKYLHVTDIIWCQEEPQNQGAWFASQHNIEACLHPQQTLNYVGRNFFAAPAVGHVGLHLEQQAALVTAALNVT